jgi:hypothetical protein
LRSFFTPRLIALNLLLAAIVCATVWKGVAEWREAQALRRTTVNVVVKPASPPPITAVPQPETPVATRYVDVVKKNLFSSDRNDEIAIEPPKVEVPKPMPPLPVATGVMKLPSGAKAFMADKAGEPTRLVSVGDKIGEFKIVALDDRNVTFDWNGKQVQKNIDDLMDRSNRPSASAGPAASGPRPAGAQAPPPPSPQGERSGTTLTATTKACKPGDTSPPGTVEDGYRKVVTPSIFGDVCRWVKQ